MEGLLRSLGSPCLHAPQHSCLKQGKNTVKPGAEHWNSYSPSDPLRTFYSYNPLAETRHVSLLIHSGFESTATNSVGLP